MEGSIPPTPPSHHRLWRRHTATSTVEISPCSSAKTFSPPGGDSPPFYKTRSTTTTTTVKEQIGEEDGKDGGGFENSLQVRLDEDLREDLQFCEEKRQLLVTMCTQLESDLKSKENALANVTSKILCREDEIRQIKKELTTARTTIASLKEDCRISETQAQTAHSEILLLQAELKGLSHRVSPREHTEALAAAQLEKDDLEKEISTLKTELAAARKECASAICSAVAAETAVAQEQGKGLLLQEALDLRSTLLQDTEERMAEMDERLSDLGQDLMNVQIAKADLEKEKVVIEKDLHRQQSLLRDTSHQMGQLIKEKGQTTSKIQVLHERLAEQKEKIEKLHATIKDRDEDVKRLRGDCLVRQADKDSLARVKESLEKKVKDLEVEKQTLEREISALKASISQHVKVEAQTKKDLASAEKKNEEFQRQRDNILSQLRQAEANATSAQSKTDDLLSDKENLQKEIQKMGQAGQTAVVALAEMEELREKLKTTNASLSRKCSELEGVIRQRDSKIESLKKSAAAWEIEKSQHCRRISRMEVEISKKQKMIGDEKTTGNELKQNLHCAKEELRAVKDEAIEKTAEIDKLAQCVTRDKGHIKKLEGQLKEARQESVDLKTELENSRLQISQLQKSIDHKKEESEEFSRQILSLTEEKHRRKSELEGHCQAAGEATAEIGKLKDLNRHLEGQVKTLVGESEKLKRQLESLQGASTLAVARLETITSLQKENSRLTKALSCTKGRPSASEGPNAVRIHVNVKGKASTAESCVASLQQRLLQKAKESLAKDVRIKELEKKAEELASTQGSTEDKGAQEKIRMYEQTLEKKNRELRSVMTELSVHRISSEKELIGKRSRVLSTKSQVMESKSVVPRRKSQYTMSSMVSNPRRM